MTVFVVNWLSAVWDILIVSAPWLLFGLVLAGLVREVLPTSFVDVHLKNEGVWGVLKASLIGIPLPLCSCSVIPVAVSLRRKGASRAGMASFMISTPEIGVDSYMLSHGLMGPVFAFSRLVASFFSAMLAGLLLLCFNKQADSDPLEVGSGIAPCCADASSENTPLEGGSEQRQSPIARVLRYSFVTMVDDLAPLLVIGFFTAGLLATLLPDDVTALAQANPMLLALGMIAASLPVYVCATASTPFAAALLLKGFPPGAVLAFLLTGPATNVTTMFVVRRELGWRGMMLYLLAIISVALLSAMIFDLCFSGFEIVTSLQDHKHEGGGLWSQVWAMSLSGLLLWRLLIGEHGLIARTD